MFILIHSSLRMEVYNIQSYFIFSWRESPLVGLGLLIHEVCFLDHTRHTTVGRTPLDE